MSTLATTRSGWLLGWLRFDNLPHFASTLRTRWKWNDKLLEDIQTRMRRTANIPAVVKTLNAAELEVFRKHFAGWSQFEHHKGIVRMGEALGALVDAERARREHQRAITRQEFEAITAGVTFGYPDR